MGPRSESELSYVVTQAALADPSWMRHPERLTGLGTEMASELSIVPLPSVPFLDRHRFFAVTDPTEKPGVRAVIIAVSGDQTARVVRSPDDFGRLLGEAGRPIASDAEALEIAAQYVRTLGTRYPQYGASVVILDSLDDIPPGPGTSMPDALRVVRRPHVEPADDGYRIDLSTWSEVGGEVKRFVIDVSRSGEIKADETTLAEGVGASWLPK